MEKILSINAGSSSIKFKIFNMPNEDEVAWGSIERIGLNDSIVSIKTNNTKLKETHQIKNHEEAVNLLIDKLISLKIMNDINEIVGVGHRVVHGGEIFKDSVLLDEEKINQIESLSELAPLHNPANVSGIKTFQNKIPNAKAVAVFDTAFHQTMEKDKYLYATPYSWYEEFGIRKYGFHGTSHKYVSERVNDLLNKDDAKVIVCHLGNGASICAVDSGQSVDTSMGFTPLAGLLMGTRSGDIDPAIISFMVEKTDSNAKEIERILNKESGLLGISGVSSDSRDIEDGINEGNERCILAQKMFINRIVSYISYYYTMLGGCDAIAFTAGIGENSQLTREQVLSNLRVLGVEFSKEANLDRGSEKLISTEDSKIKCFIIPTNEELVIARDCYRLIK